MSTRQEHKKIVDFVIHNRNAIYQQIAPNHKEKDVEAVKMAIGLFIETNPDLMNLPSGTVVLGLQMCADAITCMMLEPEQVQ